MPPQPGGHSGSSLGGCHLWGVLRAPRELCPPVPVSALALGALWAAPPLGEHGVLAGPDGDTRGLSPRWTGLLSMARAAALALRCAETKPSGFCLPSPPLLAGMGRCPCRELPQTLPVGSPERRESNL